ncbi:RNA polymerase sigma factor [Brevundimonas sp.]|uniref:RNA polymerase sigma factor n=1 Tax=Brevundimonas sp. TaxID=1871086 RepID=UPI0025841F01|nr:RNA polymerase sigma factor [Brevundimonas sp.]
MEAHRNAEQHRLNSRWRPALMAFFLRRVRDHAEAEDLTQEVFVRMLKGEVAGAADSYVFQIAQNLLVDRARRASVRRQYRDRLGRSDALDFDPIDPERSALGRAELARFAAALSALPERTRVMFTLYRIDQMSQDAIGEAFGISKSAVKKQIASAMVAIMVRMREDA